MQALAAALFSDIDVTLKWLQSCHTWLFVLHGHFSIQSAKHFEAPLFGYQHRQSKNARSKCEIRAVDVMHKAFWFLATSTIDQKMYGQSAKFELWTSCMGYGIKQCVQR